MIDAVRRIWAGIIWIFVIMIPIQFYLAGHGAMEGAHAADNSIVPMKSGWDPHAVFGTLMLLVSLLILLAALAARPPRRLVGMSAGLLLFMIIQILLPNLNDSASTRWIAALHGVNALVVTGVAIGLAVRTMSYLPFRSGSVSSTEAPAVTT